METHVLIPPFLSLKVRPPNSCSSPTVAKLLEPEVSVLTNKELPAGLRISPAEGTKRCAKLDIYSSFNHPNQLQYGCYEDLLAAPFYSSSIDEVRVRLCNWTRFLTFQNGHQDEKLLPRKRANIRCTKAIDGQVVYETLENIPPNTDLVVAPLITKARLEDANSVHVLSYTIQTIAAYMRDCPLDLSTPLLSPLSEIHFKIPTPALASPQIEDRVSVSSDSGVSSCEEADKPRTRSPKASLMIPKKLNSKKKMLPCSFCGKCFDRPSLLNRHLRTHTGERPHVCDICDKGFSTSSSLNTHRRIHSGEKPHECSTCGKRFTASSNLYYHRMTHVKEKPHKCELCQKSFPTPGDLKSHMYIHNGSWPHRCHICDRGFSKVTNLKNHLFLHTGQKPHECPICDKRFALGCNMKAHLKTHDPNRNKENNHAVKEELDEDEEMMDLENEEEAMLNVTD